MTSAEDVRGLDGMDQAGVIKDLVLLSCVGVRPVLVHGGGPEINTWLSKLNIEPVFHNGIRVTDRLRSVAPLRFSLMGMM